MGRRPQSFCLCFMNKKCVWQSPIFCKTGLDPTTKSLLNEIKQVCHWQLYQSGCFSKNHGTVSCLQLCIHTPYHLLYREEQFLADHILICHIFFYLLFIEIMNFYLKCCTLKIHDANMAHLCSQPSSCSESLLHFPGNSQFQFPSLQLTGSAAGNETEPALFKQHQYHTGRLTTGIERCCAKI